MELRPVTSSNIEAEVYDVKNERLGLRFKGGKVYCYAGVDQATYDAFLAAESKGRFVHQVLKSKLVQEPTEPVEPRPLAFIQPDECCADALSKALAAGKLKGDSWVHSKCGAEWRLHAHEGTPFWRPHSPVEVF